MPTSTMTPTIKLALTGGPSGGKTTLANTLAREFSHQVVIVPEAASLIFAGGFPRKSGTHHVEARQRAIYFVQRELEHVLVKDNPNRLLVCDRGSLDGAAYWPHDEPDFLSSVSSDLETEVSRYDWVIHLDTAPKSYYDTTNPLRVEGFEEAWALNEKVKEAWATHPQRLVINNKGHFLDKLHRALFAVQEIIAGVPYATIQNRITQMQSSSVDKSLEDSIEILTVLSNHASTDHISSPEL